MKNLLVFLLILAASLCPSALAVIRKCFACRSRGEEGDCRDPFYLSTNSTLLESRVSGVEMPPCASGWCSKIIEGLDNLYKDAEYGVATERDCLPRPPSDGKERCANIRRNNKMVHMCFCKGNLCNGADKMTTAVPGMALAASIVLVMML